MKSRISKRVLPRGPHDLSRAEVEQSQRERLFIGIIESVAEKGYAQTSVADILARSGVSRATFYAQFTDKEDCFRAAYEKAAGQVASVMASGVQNLFAGVDDGTPLTPMQQLEWVLGLYLDMLASQPAFAKAFLVEVYAAGPKAIQQRQDSLEGFINIIAFAIREKPGLFGEGPNQYFAIKLLVHGISSMVTAMIGTGETARLPELREPLMRLAESLLDGA